MRIAMKAMSALFRMLKLSLIARSKTNSSIIPTLYKFDKKSTKIVVYVLAVALHNAVVAVISLQPDLAALLTLQHHALTHHALQSQFIAAIAHILSALLAKCSESCSANSTDMLHGNVEYSVQSETGLADFEYF